MKKLIFIASFILAFTACKKDEGVIPGPGITGGVKLVESISIATNDVNERLSFEYDKSNRVVKIQSMDKQQDYQEVQYGDNKIIITQHADFESQTLTSDCTVEGGNKITSNKFTEIYDGNTDEMGTAYYQYGLDNTLKKLNFSNNDEEIGAKFSTIGTYTWTDGNLTGCNLVLTADFEDTEMTIMTSTAKITYLDKENNNTNLDFNWYLLNQIANETYDYTGILGYMGKPCKNYIASMEMSQTGMASDDSMKIKVEYVFDTEGRPTQMKVYEVNSNGSSELYETYDITYKK